MTTIATPEWFTRALASLRAGDVDGFVQMDHDDAVHEFPFAPEGRPERLEGKAAIAQYMKNLPRWCSSTPSTKCGFARRATS